MRLAACASFVLALVLPSCVYAETIPHTEVTTLTGERVTFPKTGSEKLLLLVLSFSHKSTADLASWNKNFKVPSATDRRVDFYELADFQGVPSFLLKMILHGMRRTLKAPESSHFAPSYSDELQWKRLVKFDQAQVCYVVLATARGDIVWQASGPASGKSAEELERALSKLLNSH